MTPLFAASMILGFQSADSLPPAGSLISKMMARYASAPTLTGTIQSVFQSGEGMVKVSTVIQYDRAKRQLYIRQNKLSGKKGTFLVVCDGKSFMYTNPIDGPDHRGRVPYLLESASRREAIRGASGSTVKETPMDLGEIYISSSQGLADCSVATDMAVARTADLEFFRNQLISFKTMELSTFGGQRAYRISGQWREYGDSPIPAGSYDLYISPEGDLAGYVTSEQISVKLTENSPPRVHKIVSSWTCDFQVGGQPDPKLFVLKRPN